MNFANDFLKMLQNKDKILEQLLKDLETCAKTQEGLEKWLELPSIYKCNDPEYIANKMHVLIKTSRRYSMILSRLILLNIVYTQGDQFSSDIGRALIKMGKGKEAMQELFQQKMRGM